MDNGARPSLCQLDPCLRPFRRRCTHLPLARHLRGVTVTLSLLGCAPKGFSLPPLSECMQRVTGTSDAVILVQRTDGTLWASAPSADYSRVAGPNGPLLASDTMDPI